MLNRLSNLSRAIPATGVAGRAMRPFSSALVGKAPEWKTVPFVQEDLAKVVAEVPDIKYYMIGEEDPKANPYANIPLDQTVLTAEEQKIEPKAAENKLKYSKLENGLKIATIDKGGMAATMGLFVNAGTRHEDPTNFGVSHFLEIMAFRSTAHLSHLRQVKTIEALGANASVQVGREHMVYQVEALREYLPILAPMLVGNVLFPRFLTWEVKEAKKCVEKAKKKLEKNPDALVTEMLHTTAYHNNTLGHKLYASEKSLHHFDADTMRNFMLKHYSPDKMVFVGVNVDHEEACKWLMRAFVDYNAIPPSNTKTDKPVYTGGDCRQEGSSELCHFAVGFETGGWNSSDLVPVTLLQTLLGGGGSFSTGGPGKGMYTRLYTDVLSKHDWVESCMAFNTMYTDSGLFGLYFTANPFRGPELGDVAVQQLANMGRVSKDDLARAKQCLKASIHMNLECRNIVFEDVARQLLMSGRVASSAEFAAAIDACTEADIARVAQQMLSKRPTVVGYGNVSTLPHYEEIVAKLGAASKKAAA